MTWRTPLALSLWLFLTSCSGSPGSESAATPAEVGGDTGTGDAGAPDAGPGDGGSTDGGTSDGGVHACETSATRYDLNDVSFLFPLPSTFAARNTLLDLSTVHARGPLLPAAVAAALPVPLASVIAPTVADLRVVAVRVDPCFPARTGNGCLPQLRLVAQPIIVSGADPTKPFVVDATVHLFYALTDAELAGTVRDRLDALKKLAGTRTSCRPLGVHPVMASEGLGGAYATGVLDMVRALCGGSNLTRVAVMQLGRPGSSWIFSAMDVAGSQITPDPVARLDGGLLSQSFGVGDVGPIGGEIMPPGNASKLPLLFDPEDLQAAPASAVLEGIDEALRIEDPLRESPRTVDCVSCHVSHRGREMALRWTKLSRDGGYTNAAYDLSLAKEPLGIGSQRAFGYFDTTASLSQRTVNESAEVAAWFGAVR